MPDDAARPSPKITEIMELLSDAGVEGELVVRIAHLAIDYGHERAIRALDRLLEERHKEMGNG